MFGETKTLHDLYVEFDNEVTSVTVCDDADGTETEFDWLFHAVNWYGENRKIHPLYSDSEPDENGRMEITLAA